MARLSLTFKRQMLTVSDGLHIGTPQTRTQFQCNDNQSFQFRNAMFAYPASVCTFPLQNMVTISPAERCSVLFSAALFLTPVVAGFHSYGSTPIFSLPFPILSCSSPVSAFHVEQRMCYESLTLLGIDQLAFPLCVVKAVKDEYSITLIMFRKGQCGMELSLRQHKTCVKFSIKILYKLVTTFYSWETSFDLKNSSYCT